VAVLPLYLIKTFRAQENQPTLALSRLTSRGCSGHEPKHNLRLLRMGGGQAYDYPCPTFVSAKIPHSLEKIQQLRRHSRSTHRFDGCVLSALRSWQVQVKLSFRGSIPFAQSYGPQDSHGASTVPLVGSKFRLASPLIWFCSTGFSEKFLNPCPVYLEGYSDPRCMAE
jgi:hypothetical protein